jgi:hypothetical protein
MSGLNSRLNFKRLCPWIIEENWGIDLAAFELFMRGDAKLKKKAVVKLLL